MSIPTDIVAIAEHANNLSSPQWKAQRDLLLAELGEQRARIAQLYRWGNKHDLSSNDPEA